MNDSGNVMDAYNGDGGPNLSDDQGLSGKQPNQADVVATDCAASGQKKPFNVEDDSRIVSATETSVCATMSKRPS